MAYRLAQAFWPGARGFARCSYTCSHGASPGVATIEVPEQDPGRLSPAGDLVMSDGVNTVRLKRCRLVAVEFAGGRGEARRLVLHVADRRWAWRFGRVDGAWNQVDPYPDPESFPTGEFTVAYGPFTPGTYRPAYKLIEDCLAAMLEVGYLIVDPPAAVPARRWETEVPAQALQSLLDELGYRLCYQPGPDRVMVAPAGVGVPLPPGNGLVSDSATVDFPARSGALGLVGGPTWYADYVPLEAVGLEDDGGVRKIDDLSYTPSTGWEKCYPPAFGRVGAEHGGRAQQLAQQSVYRLYRPRMIDPGDGASTWMSVAGYGRVYDRRQLRLAPAVYGLSRDATGKLETSEPFCVGVTYLARPDTDPTPLPAGVAFSSFGNTQLNNDAKLPLKFRIDSERGLVTFETYQYRKFGGAGNPTGPITPALLYLYTSFNVLSPRGLVPEAFTKGGVNPAAFDPAVPTEFLRHPELVRCVLATRDVRSWTLRDLVDNEADLLPAADYYLRAADAKYEVKGAGTRVYPGVLPVDPDGAITQVTYSLGGGAPCTTTVSRNTEHAQYLPSYPERRRNERFEEFAAAFARARAARSGLAAAGPTR